MEIHEITQRRAKQLDEVNWGAVPGALAGMAKQAVQQKLNPYQDRVGPVAAVGQETNVANRLTGQIVAQAATQADKNWRNGVMTKAAEFKHNTQNWDRTDIETMLRTYVQNRILAGRDISALGSTVDNQIKKIAYKTKNLGSLSTPADSRKWDQSQISADWQKLMVAIRDAQAADPVSATGVGVSNTPGTGPSGVALNPTTQAIARSIAPYTTSIASLLPSNYKTTQISPTNNSSVNAILANLGLLKGYKSGTP